jgi:putative transposase
MRKQHTAQFKAQVVREALRKRSRWRNWRVSLASTTQISTWKTTALQELGQVFERGDTLSRERERHEKEREELYAQIGRLTTQVEWCKKNLVSFPSGTPEHDRSRRS